MPVALWGFLPSAQSRPDFADFADFATKISDQKKAPEMGAKRGGGALVLGVRHGQHQIGEAASEAGEAAGCHPIDNPVFTIPSGERFAVIDKTLVVDKLRPARLISLFQEAGLPAGDYLQAATSSAAWSHSEPYQSSALRLAASASASSLDSASTDTRMVFLSSMRYSIMLPP